MSTKELETQPDYELEERSLRECVRILEGLSHTARERVLGYLEDLRINEWTVRNQWGEKVLEKRRRKPSASSASAETEESDFSSGVPSE